MPPLKPGGGASSKPKPPRGGPGARPADDTPKPTKPKPTKPKPTKPKPTPSPSPSPAPAPTPTPTPTPVSEPVVAEPTLTDEERAAKAEADAKAAAAAEKLVTSKAVFTNAIKVFFPGAENDGWINDLFESAKPYLDQNFEDSVILDMMLQDGKPPEKFNQRFSGIFELDKKRDAGQAVYVPSIAEYISGEEEYTRLATKLGMSNLATIENYGKIVGNDVSLDEVRDRIADATSRVNSLDEATMKQLKVEFPNMTQASCLLLNVAMGWSVVQIQQGGRMPSEPDQHHWMG